MSALREEIRAILREELAALRSEASASIEKVRITSTAELDRFARDLVRRAASPDFSRVVAEGQVRFELVGPSASAPPATSTMDIVTSSPPAAAPTLDKTLITERDIAALEPSVRSLRLAKRSRLTPLARDEARRRGIRIERISS